MKLTNIFWSLMILVLVLFVPGTFYRNNSKMGGGAELLGLFLLVWLATTVASPILLTLSWIKVVKRPLEFPFTLLAVFNLYFGSYGVYMITTGQVYRPGPFALEIFVLNLVWAILIIWHKMKPAANRSES